MSEVTDTITIPRAEYNELISARQIALALVDVQDVQSEFVTVRAYATLRDAAKRLFSIDSKH